MEGNQKKISFRDRKSLGPISNQVGFDGLETAPFTGENTNPILGISAVGMSSPFELCGTAAIEELS